MPRRRNTRAQTAPPKPTHLELPGLKVTEDMTRKEKEEQLDIFFKDFDFKVKNSLRTLNFEATKAKLKMKGFFTKHLQQVPAPLLDMTLKDFAAAGGTFEAALKAKQEIDKAKIYTEINNRVGNLPVSKDDQLTAIEEESSEEQTHRKKEAAPKSSKPERKGITPAQRQSVRASKSRYASRTVKQGWLSTPAITPKFDPRLPQTPDNIRDVKPGERVMSLAGSPLNVREKRKKADAAAASQANIEDVCGQFSSIFGADLTPNRVERALRIGGLIK
ncbi:Borealin-like [Plakobranchus ocellatus]|uniref:Borealin-like n=1 Tax=Plakobranchus ocellatus TaxID=259542 RepID=A0AAV4A106_9GAST|nr:Borealin-like [Plakobranchus ocellatus]